MKYKFFACALVLTHTTLAQTNALPGWEQCLEQTRASSPELVSARAAVRQLEFGATSASSGFLPQISASASASRGQSEVRGSWFDTEGSGADVNLSQDLFSGGGNVAARKRALAQLEIGQEQYRKALADVELRVRLAYLDVLYAQNLIDLTDKIRGRRSNNVRLIQLRFDGGRENAGSLARSKAQLAQAAFEVREARRALNYALRNLASAMGLKNPGPGVSGDLAAKSPDEIADFDGLMEQTPEYLIARTQIEASKQGMKVARSGRFPSIVFNASAGINSGNYDVYDGRWNMSLGAAIPLYTGNRLKSDVAAAKERIVQSEMDLLNTANTLLATLQQRWNSYADAVESEAVQKGLLDAELLRAEISTAKYKQGLLSYEDWDQIESTLISQGKTHLQLRRSAESERARWRNTLGLSEWQTEEKGN